MIIADWRRVSTDGTRNISRAVAALRERRRYPSLVKSACASAGKTGARLGSSKCHPLSAWQPVALFDDVGVVKILKEKQRVSISVLVLIAQLPTLAFFRDPYAVRVTLQVVY